MYTLQQIEDLLNYIRVNKWGESLLFLNIERDRVSYRDIDNQIHARDISSLMKEIENMRKECEQNEQN